MRPDLPSSPPSPDVHPQKVWDDAQTLLSAVRSTLADLLKEVQSGDPSALRALGMKQAELETALKRAFEAEGRYNEWRTKQAVGAAAVAASGAPEIDFDELREDIACRLARLRACCQEP